MAVQTQKRLRCPECHALLVFPEGFTQRKARCGACKKPFRIPLVDENDILGWIGNGNKDDSFHGAKIDGLKDAVSKVDNEEKLQATKHHESLSTGVEGLSLVRIGRHGIVFQVTADLLESEAFRSSIPRKCMRCGTDSHIQPHPIIFTHDLQDSSQVEAEFGMVKLDLSERELRQMDTKEVLAQIPELRKLHKPFNLPFPYWMCDMCRPDGLIFARGEVHSNAPTVGTFRIGRIWRAEEFLREIGGEDSPAHKALLDVIKNNVETPWEQLAGVVQHRIQQWYRPQKGERFVVYVPLLTRTRTEKGMAGLLVSNRRLIYHCDRRHKECIKGEPLELDFAMHDEKLTLHIIGANWELQNLLVDRPGLTALRRALAKEQFPANWK